MAASATSIIRRALEGTGIELVGSCDVAAYDACAPEPLRSSAYLPGARGVVVAGSAGPALWRGFTARTAERPALLRSAHPYDDFVARLLANADAALVEAGVRFQRFEAAVHAPVPVDFLALAQLVGLGSPGPFGLLIHREHGPWWALRGAWIVDAPVDARAQPHVDAPGPCAGCPAPCVGGWANAGGIERATAEVRGLCVVGQSSRYDGDQIAFHYRRAATVAAVAATRTG